MKIFESVKKGMTKENAAYPEALILEPVKLTHICTVEISPDSAMDRKYDYVAKKLVEQITRNKKILCCGKK